MIYCIRTMQMKKRFRGHSNPGFLTQLGGKDIFDSISLLMFHLASIFYVKKVLNKRRRICFIYNFTNIAIDCNKVIAFNAQ